MMHEDNVEVKRKGLPSPCVLQKCKGVGDQASAIDWLKVAAVCLTVLGQIFFFCCCAIFGINYYDSGNSSLYRIFVMLACVLCGVSVFHEVVVNKARYPRAMWLLLLFSLVVLLDLLINKEKFGSYNFLVYYIGLALPGLASGLLASNTKVFSCMKRLIDPFVLFVVAGVFLYEYRHYYGIWWINASSGFGHQLTSYSGAFAFGLNVWSVQKCEDTDRLRVFQSRLFHLLRIAFFPVLACLVLLSGGRGGAALMILYGIVFAVWLCFSKGKSFVSGAAIILLSVLIIASAAQHLDVGAFYGLYRLVNAGDNRSAVFLEALQLIIESPVLGYGFGGYGQLLTVPYPHNLILDILLSGGIIGFCVFFYFVCWLAKNYLILRSVDESRMTLVAIFATYSVIYLFVSGTFLSNPYIWFVAAYITVRSHEREPVCVRD